MDQGIYEAQAKKSWKIMTLRLVAAILIMLICAAITVFQVWSNEKSCKTVSENNSVRNMTEGDYVKITSNNFAYTGYYFYEGQDKGEEKASSYVYIVPVYFKEVLVEFIVVESLKDYRKDQELPDDQIRPMRTFKGLLKEEEKIYTQDYIDLLVDWDFTQEEAEALLSSYTIGTEKPEVEPIWLFAIGGLVFAIIVLGQFRTTKKLKKRMEDYNVSEMAMHNFDMEYQRGHDTFGKVELTEHWLLNRLAGATCLLPLKEVVWVYQRVVKNYTNGIYSGSTYTVELYFSDKGTLTLQSKRKAVEGTMDSIIARCPYALVGHSPERAKAWKDDYTQIVRASREKAIETERMARAEREAEEDDTPKESVEYEV